MCMKGNNSISVILPFYNNRQTAKKKIGSMIPPLCIMKPICS